MSFANPASGARDAAAAYTKALLDLLGERDHMEILNAMPTTIRTLLASVDDKALRAPEKPGKWSMLQVAQHLADTDLVVGYRYRMIVAHDEPEIQGFDQDLFAQRLWRGDEPADVVLAQFDGVRSANLRLLRMLTEEEWERVGLHAERGRESVRHLAKLAAAHDLVHAAQLERIRAAVTG